MVLTPSIVGGAWCARNTPALARSWHSMECNSLLSNSIVPLIVISEVNVQIKDSPIGHWFDDDLVQPGRYFDKLVSEEVTGLVIHDENAPKIIKKTDRNL